MVYVVIFRRWKLFAHLPFDVERPISRIGVDDVASPLQVEGADDIVSVALVGQWSLTVRGWDGLVTSHLGCSGS